MSILKKIARFLNTASAFSAGGMATPRIAPYHYKPIDPAIINAANGLGISPEQLAEDLNIPGEVVYITGHSIEHKKIQALEGLVMSAYNEGFKNGHARAWKHEKEAFVHADWITSKTRKKLSQLARQYKVKP